MALPLYYRLGAYTTFLGFKSPLFILGISSPSAAIISGPGAILRRRIR